MTNQEQPEREDDRLEREDFDATRAVAPRQREQSANQRPVGLFRRSFQSGRKARRASLSPTVATVTFWRKLSKAL